MENLARTLYIGKAEGKNPNIYDVKFKLSTKMIQIGLRTSGNIPPLILLIPSGLESGYSNSSQNYFIQPPPRTTSSE